jgi:hypothetical protein
MQPYDMLSILVLILSCCLAGYFVFIFMNPQSSFNILPPGRGGGGLLDVPTATITPLQLEPTWTASPTLELTPSNTPRPTATAFFTNTPVSLVPPTRTPRPTSTPKLPFSATTSQVESTLIHPDLSCNWAGIGGTVVNANNSPIIGQVVVLRGSLDGKTIEQQTVSGINKEYGESGFEFVLGIAPIASTTLYVQLVDLSGIPLSDKIAVTTSPDCTKNLVLVRFRKNN